jgi:hypothetical protein
MLVESTRKPDPIVRRISNISQCCNTIRMRSIPVIIFVDNRRVPFLVDDCKNNSQQCMTVLPYSSHPVVQFVCKVLPILAAFQLARKFSPVASIMRHRLVVFASQPYIPRVLRAVDLYDNMHVLKKNEIKYLFFAFQFCSLRAQSSMHSTASHS